MLAALPGGATRDAEQRDFSIYRAAFPVLDSVMRSADEWLGSEETGAAFSHCVSCRVPLLEIDAPWLVNKDYFRDECVLEYAVCQPCRDRTSGGISEESKTAIRHFLETEIDWDERLAEFMSQPDPAARFSHCIACRTPRELTDAFAVSALFDSAGNLVTGPLPLLICRTCIDRMTELLSDQSRDLWRRFLEEHFDGPPDDRPFPGLL
jgi:hypothetical protein